MTDSSSGSGSGSAGGVKRRGAGNRNCFVAPEQQQHAAQKPMDAGPSQQYVAVPSAVSVRSCCMQLVAREPTVRLLWQQLAGALHLAVLFAVRSGFQQQQQQQQRLGAPC